MAAIVCGAVLSHRDILLYAPRLRRSARWADDAAFGAAHHVSYNQCMRWTDREAVAADGYLFWGAEYWLLRKRQGDHSYLGAFGRILENA